METTPELWRIRLTGPAQADFRSAVRSSRKQFGAKHASIYRQAILRVLADLTTGPNLPGSKSRDDLLPGLRSVRVARHQKRSPHVALYRVSEPGVIEVLRILHGAMDFARHLSPGA